MKKLIILSLITLLCLGIGWYLYLLSIERSRDIASTREVIRTPSPRVEDTIVNVPSTTKKWFFTRVDSLHYATGSVVVKKSGDGYDIVLSEDFFTPSAPDLYVWISQQSDFSGWLDQTISYLDLGPLQRNTGSSTFRISQNELDRYGWSIIIWCKAFSIYFSHATLN
jgi:hypothetical protein